MKSISLPLPAHWDNTSWNTATQHTLLLSSCKSAASVSCLSLISSAREIDNIRVIVQITMWLLSSVHSSLCAKCLRMRPFLPAPSNTHTSSAHCQVLCISWTIFFIRLPDQHLCYLFVCSLYPLPYCTLLYSLHKSKERISSLYFCYLFLEHSRSSMNIYYMKKMCVLLCALSSFFSTLKRGRQGKYDYLLYRQRTQVQRGSRFVHYQRAGKL